MKGKKREQYYLGHKLRESVSLHAKGKKIKYSESDTQGGIVLTQVSCISTIRPTGRCRGFLDLILAAL